MEPSPVLLTKVLQDPGDPLHVSQSVPKQHKSVSFTSSKTNHDSSSHEENITNMFILCKITTPNLNSPP